MCRCLTPLHYWINLLMFIAVPICWSRITENNIVESLEGNLSHVVSENSSEISLIRLENPNAAFGVFIDLKSEWSFHSSILDYIDLKEELIFDLNGSVISIDLEKSLHENAVVPRFICIRNRYIMTGENVNNNGYDVTSCARKSSLLGIRAEGDRISLSADGVIEIPANKKISFLLFGNDFTVGTQIAFTNERGLKGSRCDNLPLVKIILLSSDNVKSDKLVKFDVYLPISSNGYYYFCVRESNQEISNWIHQGFDAWLSVIVVGRILPIELQALIICALLVLSGLFSGLNLGLMTLECTELQVLEKCGTHAEKKNARKIYPIRKKSNYLLCSLLLGNVLVNNTLTILLDDLTSGVIAIILSTFGIVIFGEIIPQAICSRHGLAIGAKTLWVTKLFMIITFPLSYPISKILDIVFGEEIRNVYNRKRLMEFIRVTKDYNDLHNEEVNIISGALELTKKTVADVMTRINDVFMVPVDAVLNFETVSDIIKRGYSRIPVYDGDKNNIVALLNIKDLAFVDPDTNTHLRTLCEFYNHPVNFVFEDTTLDVMLNEFKKGRSHLAFVRCVNSDEEVDPFYELLGIVTLEDVIEEIIQSEIIDETDVLTDNRGRNIRKESQTRQDFSDFARLGGGGDRKSTAISPQLALATYQYISTTIKPFTREYLSEAVLKKLMSQDIFFKTKRGKDDDVSPSSVLYQNGKSIDYFVLILEGRCRVTVGRENLVFETGPFSSFGLSAISMNGSELAQSTSSNYSPDKNPPLKAFIPDYTVVTVGETLYMKVHHAVYISARKATIMERQRRPEDNSKGSKMFSIQNSRGSSTDLPEEIVE